MFNQSESYIRINEKYLKRVKLVTKSYEMKLGSNKIPFPLENGERGKYEEMLYKPEPLWKWNWKNKNIGAITHSKHYLLHRYWGKPHNVVAEYIKNFTKVNDLVLDPFMGSVVPIECSKNNRRAIGVDLNFFCFLVENTINKIDLKKLEKEFSKIIHENKRKYKDLYNTTCKKIL